MDERQAVDAYMVLRQKYEKLELRTEFLFQYCDSLADRIARLETQGVRFQSVNPRSGEDNAEQSSRPA